MPYWITDDNESILKVKNKCITDNEMKQGNVYNTNIEFNAYGFNTDDGDFIQGMYCKIPVYKRLEINVNIENNEDN